ncbi:MAG: hypothetical protein HND52_17810 [Ignavibacteriae bacterium]|nr:hypothetical protein [Ignavibacteriota bacterium]NOG99820.1 hypothetical protein [Ignavibacteriota bacterium]
MFTKKILSVIIISVIFNSILFGQSNSTKVIAKVGEEEITIDEFKKRFELVPQINKPNKSEEALKAELLYSIIAEKLWAQEAENLGLDTTNVIKYTFENLKKMYARDALYKKEIESNINIDEEKISKVFLRSRKKLNLQFLKALSINEADSLYRLLEKGESFGTLLNKWNSSFGKDSLFTISYGDFPVEIEDELYRLKVSEYSKPIKASNGWYIFKLFSIDEIPFGSDRQVSKEYLNLKRNLEQTIEDELNRNYLVKLLGDKSVTTNGYLFWTFSDNIIEQLKRKKEKEGIPDFGDIKFSSADFSNVESEIGEDSLNMNFINLGKRDIKLKEFYYAFAYEGFYSNSINPDTVRAKLNSRVKRFIEHEILTEEAKRQNLNELPEVKNQVNTWRGNYLGRLYEKKIKNSVEITEGEAKQKFEEEADFTSPMQVNIFEILTDSLEIVEKVFKCLDEGERFQDIAREYTIRKETKENNGEFGYFPITEHGEIGKIASQLELGEVYGPLNLAEGYSIIKLIGKREPVVKSELNFEEVKDTYIKQLKNMEILKTKIDKTVELANKYEIDINHKVLQSIKVNNLSMLVFKNFGFGGMGMAMPIISPFYEWVEKWQNSQQDLP